MARSEHATVETPPSSSAVSVPLRRHALLSSLPELMSRPVRDARVLEGAGRSLPESGVGPEGVARQLQASGSSVVERGSGPVSGARALHGAGRSLPEGVARQLQLEASRLVELGSGPLRGAGQGTHPALEVEVEDRAAAATTPWWVSIIETNFSWIFRVLRKRK